MAKAVVTFVDEDEGGLKVTVEFKPQLKKGKGLSAAQRIALAFLEGAHQQAGDDLIAWSEKPAKKKK